MLLLYNNNPPVPVKVFNFSKLKLTTERAIAGSGLLVVYIYRSGSSTERKELRLLSGVVYHSQQNVLP